MADPAAGQQLGHLVVHARAVLGEELARVALAIRSRRPLVGGLRGGLLAGDHLHLGAAQAGGDLERARSPRLAPRPRAASRRSPTPASRTGAASAARRSVRPATASWKASVSTARGHIACSSRGGPGSTTIVGLPGTTSPARCPPGRSRGRPRARAPACGWRRAPRRSPSGGSASSAAAGCRRCRSSRSSSSNSGRPVNAATISTVRSSAVGPRPPLVITRSTPWSAMKRELRLDVLRAVAADRDVGQLHAQLEQPVGQPGPVAVAARAR